LEPLNQIRLNGDSTIEVGAGCIWKSVNLKFSLFLESVKIF
jgi:hypothetical protein